MLLEKKQDNQKLTLVNVMKPNNRTKSMSKGQLLKNGSMRISTMESYDVDEEE